MVHAQQTGRMSRRTFLGAMAASAVLVACDSGGSGSSSASSTTTAPSVPVPRLPDNPFTLGVASGDPAALAWAHRQGLPVFILGGGSNLVAPDVAGAPVPHLSLVPMTGFRISPNPYMAENEPEVYMNMGHTAERVADEWGISRADMDEFAYQSHQKAAHAIDTSRTTIRNTG